MAQTQIHIYLHVYDVSFRVNHHNLKLNEAQNQQIFYAEFLILCRINKKGKLAQHINTQIHTFAY